jgi:DNA invertase Pin-like site-specific DNA recombinase
LKDATDTNTLELPGHGHKIGYARVSTDDQTLDMQTDALKRAGCSTIYQEHASGKDKNRPELAQALKALRPGDTLAVWRLDRLGRSLPHLVETVAELEARGVGFESLTEKIDTSSATGRLTFHIFASLAQFERELIRERTHEGLRAARARGRMGGRKPALTPAKLKQAKAMMRDRATPVNDIAATLGIARSTLYKLTKGTP